MHDIQRRRRRNQPEIDQPVLEFQKSDLSLQEFSQNVGVQVQTVVRWLKTALVDLTHQPNRHAERLKHSDSPGQFVAVEVRQSPSVHPIPASMSCDWPEIVAPSGWKLRVPLGPEFGWVCELLTQLPRC
jgi:hypothetical protein